MQIAYLFDRPLPAKETDSEQAMHTIAALARRGHRIHVVLPRGHSDTSHAHLCAYYRIDAPFEVVTIPALLRGVGAIRKSVHAIRAMRHPAIQSADVLYTRNFPTLFALAARGTLPFAYETYRPWAEQFPPLALPFRKSMASPRFVGAVLHSNFARNHYARLGVDETRLEVVHNGYEPRLFEPRLSRDEARQRLGLDPNRPLAVYTGHVNATKGLDVVLAVAKQLTDVDFLFVGSEGRGLIDQLARGRQNVRILPWQPFDRVVQYLFAADILLQPPSRFPLKVVGNTVLPMKLFLYLAAGRPILAPDAEDVREVLKNRDNALLVPPGDAAQASAAIREILTNEDLRRQLGSEALATSNGLTWDARAAKIERFLERRLAQLAPTN